MVLPIRAEERAIESLGDETLRPLLQAWRALKGERPWLDRASLLPERLPAAALPHMALLERVPPDAEHADTADFRIRIVGDEIENRRLGYVRGALVSGIRPDWYAQHLLDGYRQSCREARPLYQRVTAIHPEEDMHYERLLLPMSARGAAADMLLVASVRSRALVRFMTYEEKDES
ncbi:MAG: hypothetical protein JNK11_05745 [Alphaproteobacteria bacterium]|nr:hypothetical protein [Alphaproteobacteria bacterium]